MSTSTNNRWLSVVTLLLLTANIVTLALLWTNKGSNKGDRQPPPPQGQAFEFLTHELKLDSAQQSAYSKMRDEHRDGQKEIQENIRKAKDDFFALLKQPNVPDSLINIFSRRAVEAEQKLDEYTFRHFQKLRAICTPAQQQKFDEIIQDALHRMAPPKRMGPPPGGGPGNGMPPPPGHDGPPPPDK